MDSLSSHSLRQHSEKNRAAEIRRRSMLRRWFRWQVAALVMGVCAPLVAGEPTPAVGRRLPSPAYLNPSPATVRPTEDRTQQILQGTSSNPYASVSTVPQAAPAIRRTAPQPTPAMVRLASNQQEGAPADAAVEPLPQAVPQPAPEAGTLLSLEQLEQTALGNHPQIASTGAQLTAAHGRAIQAGLYPNPVVGMGSPQAAGDESQYNGFVSQDIVTRGKLRLSRSAAYQEVIQSELAIVRARYDVLTGVRKHFYATLASQQRVFLLQELVKIAVRSEQIGNARLEAKLDSKIDTLLLGVELSKSQVALVNAETVLNTNRRQLAAAIGVPDMNIGTLAGDLSTSLPDIDAVTLQGQVQQSNSLVGIAEAEIRRNELLLSRAVVEPFPNVNLMGGYQRQLIGNRDQALFQVSLPLPLWNRNQGNIQAAQANVQRSEADYRQVQVSLASITADAVARYQTSQQLVKKYTDQILPRSRESLLLTQRRYQEGEINFLELLQAQRTMNEVNLSYIAAQELRWQAAAEIASLMQVESLTEVGPPPVEAVPPAPIP